MDAAAVARERGPVPEDVLLALTQVCRRVVRARVTGPQDREDLEQEAVTRTLGARDRLTDDALVPYGATVARNVTAEHAASRRRERGSLHRLHEPPVSVEPVDTVAAAEERAAVLEAVRRLRPVDRVLLLDHVLDGKALAEAGSEGSGAARPGARAARLARARAKARVEYVLVVRGQHLPGAVCRQVLVAVSAADTRRQAALDVPTHLALCPVCPDLVEPLAQRRSGLAAFLPLPLAGGLARFVKVSRRPSARAATAGAAALVLVGSVAAGASFIRSPGGLREGSARPAAGVASLTNPATGPNGSAAAGVRPTANRAVTKPAAAAIGSPAPIDAGAHAPASGSRSASGSNTSAPGQPLGACHFTPASTRLDAACAAAVTAAAQQIAAENISRIVVTGMTDATGERAANRTLAAARAGAVAKRLRVLLGPGVTVSASGSGAAARQDGEPDREQRRATITVA